MKAENPLSVSSPFLAATSLPTKIGALALPLLFALACGGSNATAPPPEAPAAPTPAAATETPPEKTASVEPSSPELAANAKSKTATPPAPATIEFPPHATVDQALNAIPQGQPRVNMADDALRAPLLNLKAYDKCKVPRSTRVNMSVAVYDGAAVGADITTKPKNAKIEECVDGVVREMSWSKVPSLNTVNASFCSSHYQDHLERRTRRPLTHLHHGRPNARATCVLRVGVFCETRGLASARPLSIERPVRRDGCLLGCFPLHAVAGRRGVRDDVSWRPWKRIHLRSMLSGSSTCGSTRTRSIANCT
jgi:hypothetical protein